MISNIVIDYKDIQKELDCKIENRKYRKKIKFKKMSIDYTKTNDLISTCYFELVFDDNKYTKIQLPQTPDDPLHFRDIKKYIDRLKDARKKTNQADALQIAHGLINGHRAVVGIFNFDFQFFF